MASRHQGKIAVAVVSCLIASLCATTALADHVTADMVRNKQDRPVKMGVSGSSKTFLLINIPYCYAGTFGALVQDSKKKYILSNNHVLAKENQNLSYGGVGGENDKIIQNGLLDTCAADSNDERVVAKLSDFIPIAFSRKRDKVKPENTVDAAIAETLFDANNNASNLVDPTGEIIGIGVVSGTDVAEIGDRVQKTGRTTMHTFGVVTATNVTVDVNYESGTARFVNQIAIRHVCDGENYSDAGDSGSSILSVPDGGVGGGAPAAVGLLFAGGGGTTIANQMNDVLEALRASQGSLITMVIGTADADENATNAAYNTTEGACPVDAGGGGPGKGGGGGRPPRGAGVPAGIDTARDVLERRSAALLALPDVIGHGISADADNNAVIELYLSSQGRRAAVALPSNLDGIAVRLVETGPIRAY